MHVEFQSLVKFFILEIVIGKKVEQVIHTVPTSTNMKHVICKLDDHKVPNKEVHIIQETGNIMVVCYQKS